MTRIHFPNFSPYLWPHALYDITHWTVCSSPVSLPASTSLSLSCDPSPVMTLVLVRLGCCNKSIIDWVASTTNFDFSQFWSLRSPRSRHWQTWCLVRTHFLLQTAIFLLCSHTGFPGGASAGDVKDAVSILGLGRSQEEEMATHSSILLGESHGQQSLTRYSLWGHTESDSTEAT